MKKYAAIAAALILLTAISSGCSGSFSTEAQKSSPVASSDESSAAAASSEVSTESVQSPEESSDPMEDPSVIENPEEKYYYQKLSEEEKKVFIRLYHTALDFGKQADFPEAIPSGTLDKVMWFLNYDCPELIHLTGDYAPIYTSNDETSVSGVGLFYNMEQKDYEKNQEEVNKVLDSIVREAGDQSDFEKEKYVYDMIFNNCVYLETEGDAGSVYGVLVKNRGRCEGISKTFMMCLRKLGVECITVVGVPLWDNDAVYLSHSWNIVKIDGEYYHVDLTADNMKTSPDAAFLPLYGLLNVDDDCIFQTRKTDSHFAAMGLPECHSDQYNYHKMNHLTIEAGSNVPERFTEILDQNFDPKQQNAVSIRIMDKTDYKNYLEQWDDMFNDYIKEKKYETINNTVYYNEVCTTIVVYAEPAESSDNSTDEIQTD